MLADKALMRYEQNSASVNWSLLGKFSWRQGLGGCYDAGSNNNINDQQGQLKQSCTTTVKVDFQGNW